MKSISRKPVLYILITAIGFLVILIYSPCLAQKSSGSSLNTFQAANNLDHGISISALEQTWNPDLKILDPIKEKDLVLLKQLGFKSIRLPVAFTWFQANHIPDEEIFARIDKVVQLCRTHRFKLVIDYHSGNLTDTNYLTETPRIINLWIKLSKRYLRESTSNLFFELYNEPPHMSAAIWRNTALAIVAAIRKVDQHRTLLIGATGYNGVDELSHFTPIPDDHIIYVYHFYEPFLFTHQGASWVADASATTGIAFPYNADTFPAMDIRVKNTWGEGNYNKYNQQGNEQYIKERLGLMKKWSGTNKVPVICGEYGAYKKYTDLNSRCNYITAVCTALKLYNMPGMLWEYNDNFSPFEGTPSLQNMPDRMKTAIGYIPKK